MAIANNLKRAREVMQSHHGTGHKTNRKKDVGGKANAHPKLLGSKIKPNNSSIAKLRKEGVAIRDGKPEYGAAEAVKPRNTTY